MLWPLRTAGSGPTCHLAHPDTQDFFSSSNTLISFLPQGLSTHCFPCPSLLRSSFYLRPTSLERSSRSDQSSHSYPLPICFHEISYLLSWSSSLTRLKIPEDSMSCLQLYSQYPAQVLVHTRSSMNSCNRCLRHE